MKRSVIFLLLLTLTSPSLSGCFGKFALTRNVYHVNASVPDKVLRNVVMWAFIIVPVYYATGLVDVIILNTIEFWSGHNPVTTAEKNFQYVEGDRRFDVRAVKIGDEVTYTINRFAGGHYQDTLSIACNLTSNTARTTYRDHAGVVRYAATGAGGMMSAHGAGRDNTDAAVSLFSLNR